MAATCSLEIVLRLVRIHDVVTNAAVMKLTNVNVYASLNSGWCSYTVE